MVKKWRSALSVLALAAICSALIFIASTNAENAVFQAVVDEYLSLELDSTHMEVNVLPSEPFASGYVTATVNTNAAAGYTLTFQDADSRNGLEREGYDEATDKSPFSIPSVSADTTYASLAADSWGYYLGSTTDTEATYKQIPLSATEIKTTDIPAADDASRVSFGVKIADTRPSGAYEDTVVITATPNIVQTMAILDTGRNVNQKLDILSHSEHIDNLVTRNYNLKNIAMATQLPENFEPFEENTLSSNESEKPIYAWYDETDEKNTIYIYSEADIIFLNPNSGSLFQDFMSLDNIDVVANWDASYVRSLAGLFRFSSISNIDGVSNWNTKNITMMNDMFNEYITNLDALSKWDTSNVESFEGIFYGMTALTDISGVANWNTSSVKNMSRAFANTTSLENIDAVSKWDTGSVEDMSMMFMGSGVENIDGAANWDTSSVTNISQLYDRASQLENVNGMIKWDLSKVTQIDYIVCGASALTDLRGLKNLDVSGISSFHTLFCGAHDNITDISGLENWDVSNMSLDHQLYTVFPNLENADGLANWVLSKRSSLSGLFYGLKKLKNIDGLANWDVSTIKNMSYMFQEASALEDIDGALNWDTSEVTTMYAMFMGASSLQNIDGALNWDTSKVADMSVMFYNTSSLQNIDGAENWNVSNVTSFGTMFYNNSSLADVSGLSKWNVNKNASLGGFFSGETGVRDLTPFNTVQRDGYKSWDLNQGCYGMFDPIPSSVVRPAWYTCEENN